MKIVAHRGASKVCGEDNSLRSFQRAIDLRCDFIELDVRRLSDGTLVCFHDDAIQGNHLNALRLEEFRTLAPYFIPTLEEAARLCSGRIGLDVELKEGGYETEVLGTVQKFAPASPLIFKSFIEATVAACAAQTSHPVGLLLGEPPDGQSPDYVALARTLDRLGARFLSPKFEHLKHGIHQAPVLNGVPMYVWTVNTPDNLEVCAHADVAGVITDRPDLAWALRKRTFASVTDAWLHDRTTHKADFNGLIDALCRVDAAGRRVHTSHVRIGAGVLSETRSWVQCLWGSNARIGVVMDHHTRSAAGNLVCALLPRHTRIELKPLSGWDKVTPHHSFAQAIVAETGNCDALIAVGSGTLNDLVKQAAHQTQKPYAAIATAASMNGYTSAITALIDRGLKSTLPSTPPCLLLADTEVLALAPVKLAQAGYADLLSKSVATADWKLGSLLASEKFLDLPGTVVHTAIERCIEHAEGLPRQSPVAIEVLMQALTLSGFAMSLAGSSSPASGGEHLISHLWDMQAYAASRLPELHGLQVGLGTLMTSRLYELVQEIPREMFRPSSLKADDLEHAHGPLWPVIREQACAFLRSPKDAQSRTDLIYKRWDEIWEEVGPMLVGSTEMRSRLRRAGISTNPQSYGFTPQQLRFALRHAADVRARYSILHLVREIGCEDELLHKTLRVFEA